MVDQSAQRTRWGLGITVVVVLLFSMWEMPRKPYSVPDVGLDFVGFTNSGGAIEALFAMTNPPNAAVSLISVGSTSQGEGVGIHDRGNFSWGSRESWGLAYAISVDTTNEPLQVVLKFQQKDGRPEENHRAGARTLW